MVLVCVVWFDFCFFLCLGFLCGDFFVCLVGVFFKFYCYFLLNLEFKKADMTSSPLALGLLPCLVSGFALHLRCVDARCWHSEMLYCLLYGD